MRRFALLGALLLSLALVAPVQAASAPSWNATVTGGGFGGTVAVSLNQSMTAGTLAIHLTGVRAGSIETLWLRAGPVGTDRGGIVRVRSWSVRSGKVNLTVTLTSQMVGWFTNAVNHRGGVHVAVTQGTHAASVLMARQK